MLIDSSAGSSVQRVMQHQSCLPHVQNARETLSPRDHHLPSRLRYDIHHHYRLRKINDENNCELLRLHLLSSSTPRRPHMRDIHSQLWLRHGFDYRSISVQRAEFGNIDFNRLESICASILASSFAGSCAMLSQANLERK